MIGGNAADTILKEYNLGWPDDTLTSSLGLRSIIPTPGARRRKGGEKMIRMTGRLLAVALLFSTTQLALAQSPSYQTPPAAASGQSDQLLKPEQLDALVAPIALYPDTLLAEIFMASTYPLEIVEAERWAQANKNLNGDTLKSAVDKQSWDDSVKSLVATPSVLEMMSKQLDWTQALGNAILAQQPDVMDAVQRLRAKAQANNKLLSTPQQTVSTQEQDGRQAIVIAPTNPDTIYVPYYDPAVVYGPWPSASYPPNYWPAPGYIAGGLIATGIAFGTGYALGRWASGGYRWGGGVNWGGNNINVNRPVNVNNVNVRNNSWTHNPVHRGGVRYTNANVAQHFGGNRNVGGGSAARMDFRGRNGQQVLNPGAGGNRPGPGGGGSLGNLGGGAGNRPNLGGGDGNRPNLGGSTGNRPGAGGNIDAGNRLSGAGNRPNAGGGNRPAATTRPAGNALANAGSGKRASLDAARGRQSLGGGGGTARAQVATRGRRWRRRSPGRCWGPRWWWGRPRRCRGPRWWRGRPGRCKGPWWRWWWPWRRTPFRPEAQARHRLSGPPRQRDWLLSLRLQRRRQSLCRRHGAGGAGSHAGSGRAGPGRLPAGLL